MNQINKLNEYCKKMLLQYEIDGDILEVNGKYYKIITDDTLILFDEDFEFNPFIESEDVDGWVYEFGGRWYTQEVGAEVTMDELCYIGKAEQKIPTKSFLGMRSGYEIMNGMGLYKDWVKKAKFLGVEALGVCERKTLSGALEFQKECQKGGIKSIIGLTIPVKESDVVDIKVYAKNFQGWLNLLKFNTKLNVEQEHYIEVDFLIENLNDLFLVVDPKAMSFAYESKILDNADFYQLDTVRFLNEDRDKEYLDNLEEFMLSDMEPISICDAFYLEQGDYLTREAMWAVAKAFDDKTDNQYFKNRDQYARELISMFDGSTKVWIKLFKKATENENSLVEQCNFIYDTDTRHLPKYEMTKAEKKQFSTNEELFLHLIKKGFAEKKFKEPQKYIDRLKKEIEVLKMGDVIDYFLGLYDIIRFSREQGFLVGIGRGSAGGSLVAYLLGIIQLNPLEFDLLFERFLNSGRMGEFQDRPAFVIELEDGNKIELVEGSLVRIERNGEEKVIFIDELKENDNLLRY